MTLLQNTNEYIKVYWLQILTDNYLDKKVSLLMYWC